MIHGWKGQLLPIQSEGQDISYECDGVYRDGILVPHVKIRASGFEGYSYGNNLVHLIVNVPKIRSKEINLVRDQIMTSSREWAGPIFEAHAKTLAINHRSSKMNSMHPSRYLFKLASFKFFRGLSTEQLGDIFPREDWPFLFLHTNGSIESKPQKEMINCSINRAPDPLSRVNAHVMRNFIEDKEIPQIYKSWQGTDTLIDSYATWSGSNNDSIILGSLRDVINESMEMSHRFATVVFLTPPWNGYPPLLQEVWVPKQSSDNLPDTVIESKLDLLARNPSNAIELEQPSLQESYWRTIGMRQLYFRLTRFPAPFENSFAYGSSAINLNHPISQALLHLLLIAFARKDQWDLPPSELNSLRTILRRVINLPGAILSDYNSWANSTVDLWESLNKLGLVAGLGVRTLTPAITHFVPGSTEQFLHVKINDGWNKQFGEIVK
jgi:hypothetical protein